MTNTARHLLRSVLLSSAAAASLAALPGLAHAQTAPAKSQEVNVEEIVVTGSRIRRPELTSVQPLQVITTESMERRGFTNVADALNDLPSVGVPISPIGDQGSFGTGRNFINIFNLGSNRTLTLVNGRRFVGGNPASIFTGASAGGQVDLNVIPTGLIDRIETVQAGGSAVYGSDAIAGVVNIITKTEYEGVEVDGLYGISDQGDAKTWRGRILGGHKFLDGKLSIAASYEYNETTALAFTDRHATAQQLTFAANPLNTSSSDGIPGAIIIFNRRIPELTEGGLLTRTGGASTSGILVSNPTAASGRQFLQLAPNGSLVPYDPGTFYQASVASGGNGLNLAELSSLQSPVKRHVATAFVKYQLTDHIRLNGEFLYSKFNSEEPFNQPIFNSALFGGNSAALRLSTSNPFLSAATRATILANAPANPALGQAALTPDPSSPGDVFFFIQRASVDIGSNKTTAEGETKRGVVSIEGDLNLLDRNFFWNASANMGESTGTFDSPNINQSRFLQAIDVTRDSSGNPICRDAAARAAGCAPLNLFGLGAPSAAALAYVGVQFESVFKILQADYQANFGGDLLHLPAGPWSFAAGYEYRAEKSDFNPNDPQEAGVGRSAAITGLVGKYHTSELYGETLVPVFGGDFTFPLMHRLDLQAAYRKIDNSQAGEDKAWSYGGQWYPIPDLMLRAQRSRSFRAPAITEVSLPTATSFFTATDPCDARNIATGPNPAARQANCAAAFSALGLPANFNLTSQVQAATVQGFTAGNPTLKNEIAKEWSMGFVYQPHFIPNLALSFDWVHVDLTNAIANFTLSSILQVCYDSPNPPADACSRFQRGTSASSRPGQILNFGEAVGNGTTATGARTGFINAGYTNFEGFTAGIDYRVDLQEYLGGAFRDWFNGDPGRLDFNAKIFHVKRQQTSVTGLGFDLNRDEGEIGNAKYRYNVDTIYTRGPLSVDWTVNYIGKSKFNNDFTLETRYPLTVKQYFLHDLSFTYRLDDWAPKWGVPMEGLKARLVIRNVLDTEPPLGATNSANAFGTYDFIGRFYQFELTGRF